MNSPLRTQRRASKRAIRLQSAGYTPPASRDEPARTHACHTPGVLMHATRSTTARCTGVAACARMLLESMHIHNSHNIQNKCMLRLACAIPRALSWPVTCRPAQWESDRGDETGGATALLIFFRGMAWPAARMSGIQGGLAVMPWVRLGGLIRLPNAGPLERPGMQRGPECRP